MISPLSVSLAGLQNASKRIETAAQNIANPQATNEPTRDIVDLSIAAQDFKAQVKVIQVQEKVQQSLLDILA